MPIIRFSERPNFGNPWSEFERIRRGIDAFQKNCTQAGMYGNLNKEYPPLNVFEQPDKLVIMAIVPGVHRDNLEISFEGKTLTIAGFHSEKPHLDTIAYQRKERSTGSFTRSLKIGVPVDCNKLTAHLADGILTITLMKRECVEPRKVQIQPL